MARGSSTSKRKDSKVQSDPVAETRNRLKKLAFSNDILSDTQAKPQVYLSPSKTVIKHHGKDIIKKSQRKNKFLFSFPGLLAPVSGGKIGELKDLGTKNPVLYLDFPQGRMKLFGTILYPKNRYLTLQFSKGGKNVMCEDYFDNMVVFSDAWWIGTKDENPEEARLDIPRELNTGQCGEYDFNGGAGVRSRSEQSVLLKGSHAGEHALKGECGDDLADHEDIMARSVKTTPVRQSERSAGKVFKFAEASEDDSTRSSHDSSEGEENNAVVHDPLTGEDASDKMDDLSLKAKDEDAMEMPPTLEGNQASISKTNTPSQAKENAHSKSHGSLIQATVSSLFKKVEEKRMRRSSITLPKVSSQKMQLSGSKRKINQDDGSKKRVVTRGRNHGVKVARKDPGYEVEDDIEALSSSEGEEEEDSDEDWTT